MSNPRLIVGGAVIVLLLCYLVIAPLVLAGTYKDKALPAQNKIAEKVTVLGEQYKRPVFTKVDTTAAADKADLEATRKALNETRDQFNQQKGDLTGFVKLPLMGVNGKYAEAITASKDAKEWTTKTEQLLTSADADLAYFEKSTTLNAKFENLGQSLNPVSENDSPEAIAQKLDQFTAELDTALTEAKQIQPTESLKKSHETQVSLVEKFSTQLKQFSAAVRAGNADQAEAISVQLDATATEGQNATNQAIIDYARDSTVNKLIAELSVLDRKLEDGFKRL